MYARMSRFAGLPPERIDQTLSQFEQGELPELERQPGFKGVMVMVDRAAGAAVAMTLWETREEMKESEKIAERAREAAVETARPVRYPLVDHYEVLLHKEA